MTTQPSPDDETSLARGRFRPDEIEEASQRRTLEAQLASGCEATNFGAANRTIVEKLRNEGWVIFTTSGGTYRLLSKPEGPFAGRWADHYHEDVLERSRFEHRLRFFRLVLELHGAVSLPAWRRLPWTLRLEHFSEVETLAEALEEKGWKIGWGSDGSGGFAWWPERRPPSKRSVQAWTVAQARAEAERLETEGRARTPNPQGDLFDAS